MKQLVEYLESLLDLSDINLSLPPNPKLGDFCISTFGLAKHYKQDPLNIAKKIAEKINKNKPAFIDKIILSGPYINFVLSDNAYIDIFRQITTDFFNEKNKDITIFVDYIGANVGKPLHIGHMCTPNLGQVIINIYRKLGYNVISDSHIGDWGIIFGKLIVAYQNWGDENKLRQNAVEHLFELYVKASKKEEENIIWREKYQAAFKKLSLGVPEYVKLWFLFTKESIKSMQIQLDKLNVKPDYNIGESFYEGLNLPKLGNYPDLIWAMKDIVKELLEKNIAQENPDASIGVIFPDNTNIPSTILQKRNGTHGYLASDLAAVKYRIYNWEPEKIIYFVDIRQALHFKQLFMISKLAGWTKGVKTKLEKEVDLIHVPNGFVKLKDGAMSTRKGKIIKLEELLNESIIRAKKIIKEKRENISEKELDLLANIIGIGAIKYEYLRKNRELDITFDWKNFMTFEGNSAPYIMYSYVRGLSILKKASKIDDSIRLLFTTKEEKNLILKLSSYREILEKVLDGYYPHILTNYIYELTKLFNVFYNKCPILSEKDSIVKNSRLKLVDKSLKIIKDGFMILGIQLPEKM